MSQPLYSVNQAAAMLNKAPVTVRKAARDHGIGQKPARVWLFTSADIEILRAVIRENRGQPRKPKKPR